jgi:hypothetical protein
MVGVLTWARSRTASRRRSLPWPLLMVAAVVVGVVGMHGLAMSQSASAAPVAAVASANGGDHDLDHTATADSSGGHASAVEGDPAPTPGHQGHGGAAECSGAMALCLALLLVGGLLLAYRCGSWWFDSLWRSLLRAPVGWPRAAFASLTPLQRTTVLRC